MASLANLSPCHVCSARPGARHDRCCPVPRQAAKALAYLTVVASSKDDPSDVRDLARALRVRNQRALTEWLRSGRSL